MARTKRTAFLSLVRGSLTIAATQALTEYYRASSRPMASRRSTASSRFQLSEPASSPAFEPRRPRAASSSSSSVATKRLAKVTKPEPGVKKRVRPKSKTVKRVHAISKTVQKKALGTQKKVKSREDQKRRLAELDKIVEEMILDDVPLQKHRIGEKQDVLRNHRIGEIVDERRSYVLRKHRIGEILDDVPLQLKRVPRNKKWPRNSLTVMSSSLTRDAICASAPKVERPGSFDKSLKAAPRRIIELDLSREGIDLD